MNTVYSQKNFSEILERERSRSERTAARFSIIGFELPGKKNSAPILQNLCRALNRRVRCYDEIGWIDKHRLGVILPDTPA